MTREGGWVEGSACMCLPDLRTASSTSPCLPQTISIPIVDDTLVEPREVFYVDLFSPSGAMLVPTASTATVTIMDNDVSGS